MTAPIYVLRGEKIGLAVPSRELVPLWTEWINDLAVVSHLAILSGGPMTLEAEQRFYDGRADKPNDILFAVYELATDRTIGSTGIHDVDHRHGRATFGIMIGARDCWNRGYGTEATRLTIDYAFEVLGLHNVLLTVYGYNKRAIRAYEKAGFKVIGRRRDARRIGAQRYDEIYMDVVASEWTSPVARGALGIAED